METISIICGKCGLKVQKPKNEINRQLRHGRTKFFCSLSCAQSFNKTTTTTLIRECLFCKKSFKSTTQKHARKCCSVECGRRYAQSYVKTERISRSVRNAWLRGDYDRVQPRVIEPRHYNFICVVCNKSFERTTKKLLRKIKTCGETCYKEFQRRKAISNPNCGGETGYKHYKYRNIWMDSSWEVQLAKWLDECSILWERSRFKHMFWWTDGDGIRRRYYPDFYIPSLNVYLDPKNKYKAKQDAFKISQVVKEHQIDLFWGDVEKIKTDLTFRRNLL